MLPTGKDDIQEKIIWENTTFIKRLGQTDPGFFLFCRRRLTKKALLSLHSPSKCSFTLSKLIHNAWLFLLAVRHRMQALSALACCVGCAFSGFASLKIALFIQPLKKRTTQFLLLGRSLYSFNHIIESGYY